MSSPLRAHLVGCAVAAAAAALFGTKGVFIKLALEAGADATALLAVRMGASLPAFALVAWWTCRRAPPLPRRTLVLIALWGLIGFHAASWLDV